MAIAMIMFMVEKLKQVPTDSCGIGVGIGVAAGSGLVVMIREISLNGFLYYSF